MNEQLDRIELKLSELQGTLEETRKAAVRTRQYMFWTGVVTVAVIVIPLLIIPFLIPAFLASVQLPAGF